MRILLSVRGWKAAAVLAVLAAACGLHQWRLRATLATEAVEALKPWIAGRFMEAALHEVEGRPLAQLSPAERNALARRLLAARRIEVRSIQARGLGEDVVVRVEVFVDGRPPPDGQTVRYYRMSYSTLLGWTFRQEVGPLSYWLALW